MKQIILFLLCTLIAFSPLQAQKKKKNKDKQEVTVVKEALDTMKLGGLKWRNVGPAITSGRISDIAVNPDNPYEYYVATSSGGVWKTTNNGLTYQPIFDSQGSYSIGCVTMDPNNSDVIWIGTGENNNQRSVAYGDGIYKSEDGGASWQHMGLKKSEHIGKIIVHPEDSDVIFVAAIGPLWSKGGDRGVYKSIDGGSTWEAVLTINEHTGVNDIVMDPRDPEVLYASAYQRRRHVFTYVGGGPGSGMHRSTDGGATWKKINKGLPTTEIGRIGLAISPVNPDKIFAIVEAAEGKGGFYMSTNKGASWKKQSSHATSGNYYQEITADPVDEDVIYSMDTWMHVSRDGGKTFKLVGEDYKHVDNHSIWIDPSNNKHLLVGCDGGIYETFDNGKTWDFKANLPITQFYKVALDNEEPFYNIYGGTQDNFSLGGPSRVNTAHGITNADWFITHGGDGFESQVDQENPDIVYAQSQYGVLVRYDRKSGEELGIQPKEREGEDAYRWNWDAPLAVSKHKSGRLYFAANKVFRSDDYGHSWDVISDDLSAQIDRNQLKVYDRIVSIDAVAKNGSTSQYGTIVALSESPLDENFIAIGTDDGLIQLSEDGGQSWRKVSNIPGAPRQSYVNNIYLSQHDANVIYAAFNHHKYGDFKPYIFKSTNKGVSWTNISNNLPDRGSVYAIEEDHVKSDLIFCGTEFGVFFSPNGGERWKKLGAGLPTIAVRDIAIQQRENDLVLGTFGRGFYVMDDYSALRTIENSAPTALATIYPIRDALMWEESVPLGLPGKSFQGDNYYTADNLGPVAMITYNYNDDYKSMKDIRKKSEQAAIKKGGDATYPTYDELRAEQDEVNDQLLFTIKDRTGQVVKKIFKKPSSGLQRFSWNLRYNSKNEISFRKPSFYNPFAGSNDGTLVAPGKYTVEMSIVKDGAIEQIHEPVTFSVSPLNNTVLPAVNKAAKVAFQKEVQILVADIRAAAQMMSEMNNKIKHMKEAIKKAEAPMEELISPLQALERKMKDVNLTMNGDRLKRRLDIDQPPTPRQRMGAINYEQKNSTSAPTKTHMDSYQIAKKEFTPIQEAIKQLYTVDITKMEELLKSAGAPYTPGRVLEEEQ